MAILSPIEIRKKLGRILMNPGDLRSRTEQWLKTHDVRINKRLGQHFLIDEQIFKHILDYACLSSKDTVLEIGAGTGTLTALLAEQAKHVSTIEMDSHLFQALQQEFRENAQITMLFGDAVKIEWPFCDKLIANLPYGISSPVIFKFLTSKIPLAILMLQREFAQRLVALPGSKAYGRLTVMVAYAAKVELLEEINPDQFFPPPAVSSAIVRITRLATPSFQVTDYQVFAQVVTALFNQRRKKLATPLKSLLEKLKLEPISIKKIKSKIPWLDLRAEELAPDQFAKISNLIVKELP